MSMLLKEPRFHSLILYLNFRLHEQLLSSNILLTVCVNKGNGGTVKIWNDATALNSSRFRSISQYRP